MIFPASFFTLALLSLPSFAAPSLLHHVQRAEEPIDGSYIVHLRENASPTEVVNSLSSSSNVTSQLGIINGFAARLTPWDLEALRTRSDILGICENGIVWPMAMPISIQYAAFA